MRQHEMPIRNLEANLNDLTKINKDMINAVKVKEMENIRKFGKTYNLQEKKTISRAIQEN